MEISTHTAVFSLTPEGILKVVFLSNELPIDLEEAKRHVEAANKLTKSQKSLVLVDARQLMHELTEEAKKYISQSPNKIAEAILVKKLHQRIVANFYFKVANTFGTHPKKVFTDETEAINWLLSIDSKR